MFNTITPQLIISPAKGKTFDSNTVYFNELKSNKAVYSYTEILAENALVRYNNKQAPALIKGVSSDFLKNQSLDSIIVDGHFVLQNDNGPNAVIGSALQSYLGVNPSDAFEPLQIYSPKKGIKAGSINPLDDFTILNILPSGVFEVQQDFDNLVIVPIEFARELLQEQKNVSAIRSM